uniref:Putative secreted protein n=1 Tax=Amblyomma triste TaxID=251400 RepID=A0A023G4N5_AMBTT
MRTEVLFVTVLFYSVCYFEKADSMLAWPLEMAIVEFQTTPPPPKGPDCVSNEGTFPNGTERFLKPPVCQSWLCIEGHWNVTSCQSPDPSLCKMPDVHGHPEFPYCCEDMRTCTADEIRKLQEEAEDRERERT